MIRLPYKVQYDPQLNVILVDPQFLGNVVISIGSRTHIKEMNFFEDEFEINLIETIKESSPDMDVSPLRRDKLIKIIETLKEYNSSTALEKDINSCLSYLKGL